MKGLKFYKEKLIEIITNDYKDLELKFIIDSDDVWMVHIINSIIVNNIISVRADISPRFGPCISLYGNDEDINLELTDDNFIILINNLHNQINYGHVINCCKNNDVKICQYEWTEKLEIDEKKVAFWAKKHLHPETWDHAQKLVYTDFLGKKSITLIKANEEFVRS